MSDATPTRYGWRARARATNNASSGDIWLSLSDPASYGEVLTGTGTFTDLEDDAWGRLSRRQGVVGQVRLRSIQTRSTVGGIKGLAVSFRNCALRSIDAASSSQRALLAGCVCGRRVELRACKLDTLFSTCGVAHLIAVSGGHIAIVSALLEILLLKCGTPPKLRAIAAALLSGLFVLSCGAPVSAVRSWLMAVVRSGAVVYGRRDYELSAVCAAASAMALVDPTCTGQLGYILSVVSVVALCLYGRYACYVAKCLALCELNRLPLPSRLNKRCIQVMRGVQDSFATSLVCQFATAPMVIASFERFSLVGPLANVLVAPLFTPFVMIGSLSCVVSSTRFKFIAAPLLAFCDLIAKLMIDLLHVLAQIPLASVPCKLEGFWTYAGVVGYGAVVIWLYAIWPDVNRRKIMVCGSIFAAFLLALLVRWRYCAPARMVVLDVGQGDAILLQDGGSAVLVDTGPAGSLTPALARMHVLHLDAVVLTHLHADHTGGLGDIAANLTCENVLVAEGAADDALSELSDSLESAHIDPAQVEELSYGDELHVGRWCLRTLWPREPTDGNTNADSLIFAVSFEAGEQSLTALLTGDAERDELASVIAYGDIGDIDVLKVGHHGSEISLGLEEAQFLNAELAVASAGEGNSYGHPTEACIEALTASGSVFICTIDAGDVYVEPGRVGPVVHTQK